MEGADFNSAFFGHPKCDPLTLSSPDPEIRRFWVEHGKACIRISSYPARELGQSKPRPCPDVSYICLYQLQKNIPIIRALFSFIFHKSDTL